VIGYQARLVLILVRRTLAPNNDMHWQPLPESAAPGAPEHQRSMGRDLLHAMATGEPTLCGVRVGRWAIEMLTAVYRSHLLRRRVEFPLADRTDPLAQVADSPVKPR
jgi:hypothetical protein